MIKMSRSGGAFWRAVLVAGMFFAGAVAAHAASNQISVIQSRGVLLCGTDDAAPGFGYLNPTTRTMEGMDVDFCKATAAAVLGDASKVKFVHVTDKSRFDAIRTGQVDVVFAHSTLTATRSSVVGVSFTPIYFYDGTGALVKKSLGVKDVADLNGATICTTQGSGTEVLWSNYVRAHDWKPSTKILTFQDDSKLYAALEAGRCDAMSTDKSALAGWKGNAQDSKDLVILPETLDKSPFAGFVSQNDPAWAVAVSWIVNATFEAEEDGITQHNLATMLKTTNPYLANFLGVTGSFGKDFGLRPDFVQKIIASVGNYGEIYARNLGPDTPWSLPRKGTLNESWTKGGLLYSPPWY